MAEPGLIVIGSGPAGVSAAEAFRNHDDLRSVRVLTADPDPPYARPPLSKGYLRGDTDDDALYPGFAPRSAAPASRPNFALAAVRP